VLTLVVRDAREGGEAGAKLGRVALPGAAHNMYSIRHHRYFTIRVVSCL
jgi:hypothetical protein